MKAKIDILCVNRIGLLNDITAAINEAHLPVVDFSFHMQKNGNAMVEATIAVSSRAQLDSVLGKLMTVRDVISAERASG